MQINSCINKIKCDVPGCKNLAHNSFINEGEKKAVINLCDDCSKELYSCLGTIIIPKNIPAPFKTKKKIGDKK